MIATEHADREPLMGGRWWRRRVFKNLGIGIALLALIGGALAFYSYHRLLALERQHMPDLSTMWPASDRSLRFVLCDPWVSFLPHGRLSYSEREVTDLTYITPSIAVDIFGCVVDASSKEVMGSLGMYR